MRVILSIIVMALMMASCESDSNVRLDTLHHDGDNANSPINIAGNHKMAARFSSGDVVDGVDQTVKSIDVYIYNEPQIISFEIYEGGIEEPTNLLYSANQTGLIRENAWNTHLLNSDITLSGDALWVVVSFTNVEAQQTIGCDAGPRNEGGDWILSEDPDWQTFQELTGSESINWNIRLNLED